MFILDVFDKRMLYMPPSRFYTHGAILFLSESRPCPPLYVLGAYAFGLGRPRHRFATIVIEKYRTRKSSDTLEHVQSRSDTANLYRLSRPFIDIDWGKCGENIAKHMPGRHQTRY